MGVQRQDQPRVTRADDRTKKLKFTPVAEQMWSWTVTTISKVNESTLEARLQLPGIQSPWTIQQLFLSSTQKLHLFALLRKWDILFILAGLWYSRCVFISLLFILH